MMAENHEQPGATYLLFDDIFVSRILLQALDLLLLLLRLRFVCALLFCQPAPDNRVREEDGSWLKGSHGQKPPRLPGCRPKKKKKKNVGGKKSQAVMVTSFQRQGHLSSFSPMFHRRRGRSEIISHRMERHKPQ